MAHSKIDQLEGPDKYHVIIGHCEKDSDLAAEIKDILSEKGLLVYDNAGESKSETFDTGISKSRKVLLLVTKNVSNGDDLWFNYQVEGAIQKTKARCMLCLVLVFIDVEFSDMSENLQTELHGFVCMTYHDDDFQNTLTDILGTEALPDPKVVPKFQMGFTLACSYYEYLKIVLPGLAQRIKTTGNMEINGTVIMSYKMFIIIPASGRCPAELSEYDKDISHYASIPFNAHQAGISARDYKSNINSIRAVENGRRKEYRAVIEYAAPLTVLKNMAEHPEYSGLTSEDYQREMNQFYFHLRAWLLKDDLLDRARLVYAEDVCPGSTQLLQLLVSAIKEEIQKESGNPVPAARYSRKVSEVKAPHLNVIREHIAVLHYDELTHHTGPTRGHCFVFNNETFTPQSGLKQREGSQEDMDHVKELFGKLKFDMRIFDDLTAAAIKDQFAEMAVEDFRNDLAVVVVIMTHGYLGNISGTDGRPVKITDLTRQLAQNSTLQRKPKMFFIQACQKGSHRSDESREELESVNLPSPETLGIEAPLAAMQHETDASPDNLNADMSGATSRVGQMSIQVPGLDLEVDADPEERIAQALLVPGAPDFLMSYATLPGMLAYRHCQFGAPYIKTLKTLLLRHHSEMALDRILKKVTQEVKEIMERCFPEEHFRVRQHPFFLDTTERLICFN